MANILARLALPVGRIATLDATLDLHHGLLGQVWRLQRSEPMKDEERVAARQRLES